MASCPFSPCFSFWILYFNEWPYHLFTWLSKSKTQELPCIATFSPYPYSLPILWLSSLPSHFCLCWPNFRYGPIIPHLDNSSGFLIYLIVARGLSLKWFHLSYSCLHFIIDLLSEPKSNSLASHAMNQSQTVSSNLLWKLPDSWPICQLSRTIYNSLNMPPSLIPRGLRTCCSLWQELPLLLFFPLVAPPWSLRITLHRKTSWITLASSEPQLSVFIASVYVFHGSDLTVIKWVYSPVTPLITNLWPCAIHPCFSRYTARPFA